MHLSELQSQVISTFFRVGCNFEQSLNNQSLNEDYLYSFTKKKWEGAGALQRITLMSKNVSGHHLDTLSPTHLTKENRRKKEC